MPTLRSAVGSSIGKKIVMAVTGLAMIVFLVLHLAGNLTLLTGAADTFNRYSHFLVSLGVLVIAIEVGLFLFLLVHVIDGVLIWVGKRRARPVGYYKNESAGGPSRKTFSSTTMIWTGLVILVFTVVHVASFKYGPGIQEGYRVELDGTVMRDVHRLVVEKFSEPAYVLFYAGCMVFLGFHLRHAFWSAFQSLGANHPRYTPFIYGLGTLVAVALGLGFLVVPVWIYLTGGGS